MTDSALLLCSFVLLFSNKICEYNLHVGENVPCDFNLETLNEIGSSVLFCFTVK